MLGFEGIGAVVLPVESAGGSGDLSYVQYIFIPLVDQQDDGASLLERITRSSGEGHCRNLVTPVWQARSPR